MDPQARAVLDRLAALAPASPAHREDARWLADFRYQTALLAKFDVEPTALHEVTHLTVPGARPLTIRLYRPKPGPLPLLLHMHGGGAIAGSVDGHDPCLRALAQRTGWLVAAPLYALAPENRFPAQLDDGWRALKVLSEQASALDIARERIVLSGDSIGATLATALALRVRDDGGPALEGQILLYPNTDLRRGASYPSRTSKSGNVISLADLERQIDLYLGDEIVRASALASPLLVRELKGLPRTLLVTCGEDPLGDEGDAYGDRLSDAGVNVDRERFEGMIHGFLQMGGHIDATSHLLDVVAKWLG